MIVAPFALEKEEPKQLTSSELKQLTDGLATLVSGGQAHSMVKLLPLIFNLNGEPYSLNDHFPFETLYRTHIPDSMVIKAGRQISKSTNLASYEILLANKIPYFKILTITPLFEMIRRFSTNYVKPFIQESPVRSMFVDHTTDGSVLQRTFINKSALLFSYAFMDCSRTRGISCGMCQFDEVQHLNSSFIPIILETMSHSPLAWERYAGTPLTLDNTLEQLWLSSSMAEWMMKCTACNYYNIPCLTHDLVKMIGPYREDISEHQPGLICARCKRPVNPRRGRWIHAKPERRWTDAGYHMPQLIFPLHYADPKKWAALKGKQEGAGNTPPHVFYNEVCGESWDQGAKLITQTDLKRAASLEQDNEIDQAVQHLDEYIHRIIAVDWGTAGEKFQSFTTVAVLGMLPDGKIDVIYGYRSLTPAEHVVEAIRVLEIMKIFRCSFIAHDYTGAGSLRETFLIQNGVPYDRVVPIAYVRAAFANIMTFKEATPRHPRNHYQVDKARSLLLTCQQIKAGWIRFFRYDYKDKENPGLLHDFLSLVEEKTPTVTGREMYKIGKNATTPDDFAQAVNIGCCTLWHISRAWPNLAAQDHYMLTPQEINEMDPETPDWGL